MLVAEAATAEERTPERLRPPRADRDASICRQMPSSPLQIIDDALNELADVITLSEATGATSHTAVVADGLDDPAAPAALGRYLLGVLAGAVQLDARLSAKYMLSGVSGHQEIVASIRRVTGDNEPFAQ